MTGTLVGPGSYNNHLLIMKKLKQPCKVKLSQLQGISQYNSDGYLLIGDQIVYDPTYITQQNKLNKKKFNANELSVDMHSGISAIVSKMYETEFLPKKEDSLNKSFKEDLNKSVSKIYGCYSLQRKLKYDNKFRGKDKLIKKSAGLFSNSFTTNEAKASNRLNNEGEIKEEIFE